MSAQDQWVREATRSGARCGMGRGGAWWGAEWAVADRGRAGCCDTRPKPNGRPSTNARQRSTIPGALVRDVLWPIAIQPLFGAAYRFTARRGTVLCCAGRPR